MNVYLVHPIPDSWAISRVLTALVSFAPPEIKFVDDSKSADFFVFNINGRHDQFARKIEEVSKNGKSYAIIQYVLRGSKNPSTSDWISIWRGAKLVWSYYDLRALCQEDKINPNFNFYHAPLGLDYAFKKFPEEKDYVIASSSQGYLTESARECILAAAAVGKKVFHIGPVITKHPNVDYSNGMDDTSLAKKYSACEFVSGLRRTEGFELPVIEGLVCGARPIVFDKPHYRHWFTDFALFIPETSRDSVVKALVKIFNKGAKPVSNTEIEKVRKKFNWEEIISGFWQKILA